MMLEDSSQTNHMQFLMKSQWNIVTLEPDIFFTVAPIGKAKFAGYCEIKVECWEIEQN